MVFMNTHDICIYLQHCHDAVLVYTIEYYRFVDDSYALAMYIVGRIGRHQHEYGYSYDLMKLIKTVTEQPH